MELAFSGGAVGRNLVDLQKALSGEFNKKIHEWEKLKGQQWLYGGMGGGGGVLLGVGGRSGVQTNAPGSHQVAEGNLPHDFRKKLHEWEKMKEKEKVNYYQSDFCLPTILFYFDWQKGSPYLMYVMVFLASQRDGSFWWPLFRESRSLDCIKL